jgi:murein DD-endopeptidase MepM/ murein hydrolase activator NlpD
MGRHGTPESDVHVGPASGSWDADSWEAAIAPSAEGSLYASTDHYQPVNDWSGVYTVPPEVLAPPAPYGDYYDYYDYESYSQPQQHPSFQPQPDQSYYESVYAAYTQPVAPEPVQDSSPMWDGPAWQDPYTAAPAPAETPAAFYGDPLTAPMIDPYAAQAYQAPAAQSYDTQAIPAYTEPAFDHQAPARGYAEPAYARPQYDDRNFHHPEFDTGEFEAVYAAPDATDAEYDLLPDGEGRYDAYDGEGYEDGDYDAEAYAAEYDADDYEASDYEDGDPDEAPIRSRSRTSAPSAKPFGSGGGAGKIRTAANGRRTLHAITSAPAAVVGVAAVAVAAVGGLRLPGHTETAQADAPPPSSGLEQNLLQMRAASAALADRATRSEQRSELSQQQALERQRLAEMAPKFFFPVQDVVLTASFGDAGARWSSLHTGQDFAVPTGSKVVSVTDGVVTESGWAGPFGYRVVVSHPDGSQTWYCHLNVIKVKSGPVKAGQLIAYSGDTGNSTGPHLHFEYHPPGPVDINTGVPGASTAVNPIPFLKSHGLLP